MNPQELMLAIKQMVASMDQTLEPKIGTIYIHPSGNSATVYVVINGAELVVDVFKTQINNEKIKLSEED